MSPFRARTVWYKSLKSWSPHLARVTLGSSNIVRRTDHVTRYQIIGISCVAECIGCDVHSDVLQDVRNQDSAFKNTRLVISFTSRVKGHAWRPARDTSTPKMFRGFHFERNFADGVSLWRMKDPERYTLRIYCRSKNSTARHSVASLRRTYTHQQYIQVRYACFCNNISKSVQMFVSHFAIYTTSAFWTAPYVISLWDCMVRMRARGLSSQTDSGEFSDIDRLQYPKLRLLKYLNVDRLWVKHQICLPHVEILFMRQTVEENSYCSQLKRIHVWLTFHELV